MSLDSHHFAPTSGWACTTSSWVIRPALCTPCPVGSQVSPRGLPSTATCRGPCEQPGPDRAVESVSVDIVQGPPHGRLIRRQIS